MDSNEEIYNKIYNSALTSNGFNSFSLNDLRKDFIVPIFLDTEIKADTFSDNTNNFFHSKIDIKIINSYIKRLSSIMKKQLNNPNAEEAVIKNIKQQLQDKKLSIQNIKNNIKNINIAIKKYQKNNNMPTITLNQLYKASSLLNVLKTIPFLSDKFIDKIIDSKVNLSDQYRFYWFDLGKYFTGIKNLISKQVLENATRDQFLLNENFNKPETDAIIKCLDNPDLPSCKTMSFNSMDTLDKTTKGLLITGGVIGAGKLMSSLLSSNGLKNAAISGLGTLGTVIIAILFLIMLMMLVNSLMPVFFWYLGVINWLLKSSILLVTFSFTTIFLVLDNRRQQVINNIFMILGQALIPLFMVGIYFLIIYMSIVIDIVAFQLVPLGSLHDVISHICFKNSY